MGTRQMRNCHSNKGKLVSAENLTLNENGSINVLQDKDHYKFPGKLENFAQLDEEVWSSRQRIFEETM